MKCNQVDCENPAAFRFTWPGRDEAGICVQHEPKLRGISFAMGLHLQIIPIVDAVDPVPANSLSPSTRETPLQGSFNSDYGKALEQDIIPH